MRGRIARPPARAAASSIGTGGVYAAPTEPGRVPWIIWVISGGHYEPDHDAGDVDGPPGDELSLVLASGDRTAAAELVTGRVHGVAVPVGLLVEPRRPPVAQRHETRSRSGSLAPAM